MRCGYIIHLAEEKHIADLDQMCSTLEVKVRQTNMAKTEHTQQGRKKESDSDSQPVPP